jgi:hypothetical protein
VNITLYTAVFLASLAQILDILAIFLTVTTLMVKIIHIKTLALARIMETYETAQKT